jgi:Rieske Fe-S protein
MSETKQPERSSGEADDAPNRRVFVAVCAAGTCAIAATIGIPSAIFLGAPLGDKAGEGRKFAVAKLSELEMNVPKKFTLVGDEVDAWTRATGRKLGAVWLMRTADRDVRALSTVCPHLGCGVDLTPDQKQFLCPCHTSAFSLDGTHIAGPSPRAMDPLPVEIGKDDVVSVTLRRFRIGIAAREEIG